MPSCSPPPAASKNPDRHSTGSPATSSPSGAWEFIPGLKTALEQFNLDTFKALLNRTAYVGEVGLDGKVKSRLNLQRAVLKGILTELQASARITSLHSYGATNELVELLESTPIEGAVLHWWLGDVAATKKAVELGAYFSINAANLKNREALDQVPLDRILTETDHPDGDRWSAQPRQPGNVTKVESELAAPLRHHRGRPASDVLEEPPRAHGIDSDPGTASTARASDPSRFVRTSGLAVQFIDQVGLADDGRAS